MKSSYTTKIDVRRENNAEDRYNINANAIIRLNLHHNSEKEADRYWHKPVAFIHMKLMHVF